MSPATPRSAYDLFVSYARADDRGEHQQKVTALVEAIKADYLRVTGTPLSVFFDTSAIRTMDDMEVKILDGLRESKMMVAVLSPAYFASDYCRKEWEVYVETELAHALPGEGITPIYVVAHPAFDAGPVEDRLKHWINDLRRRQFIEWRPFWPEGAHALEREDVRRRLEALPGQIAERLQRAAVRDAAPSNVPLPSQHFVGRRDELHALRKELVRGRIGAITAVHGIPGIGKSMLAFAYAWGYGYEYPGGRFLIPAANLSDLAAGLIALADDPLRLPLTDEERQRPEVVLGKVKAVLEQGPPALLVVDNLDDPSLLAPQARDRALPRGGHVHVLITTRVSPDDLPRMRCLPLDALRTEDALALLQGFRPIADSPQDDEWKAALEIVNDRLGGHALAVEAVGVYLRENPDITYRQLARTLEEEGVTLLEEEVGPEARGRLAWHTESCIARLLEPTLNALSPDERLAVEYASFLPPDNIPLPWLRALLSAGSPEGGPTTLRDPITDVFQRLHRLRLVVAFEHERGATPSANAGAVAGPARLARMHRLVQDVVRARLGPDDASGREETVVRFAGDRASWLQRHWGQVGLAWELPPLRDLALRRIDQGDHRGCVLADHIATPLRHAGRLVDVRTLWLRSADLLRQRSAAAPEDAGYARALAASYNHLGDLARSGGDPAATRRYYGDGLAIARRLGAAAPEDAGCARDLSISYERLGDLARSGGDPAAARRYYNDMLAIHQRLTKAAPEDAGYARDLSRSYERLGDLAVSAGDPAAARRYYQDGLAIRERLAAAAPEDAVCARGLGVSYDRLGDLAVSAGDPAAARRYYEDGLAIARRLAAAAPEDAGCARDLAVSYTKLGDLAASGGDPAAARRYYEDSLAISRRVAAAAPEDAGCARDLAVSYTRLGDLAASGGDPAAARRYYQDGLAIRERLAAAAPEDAGCARDLWVSYWRMAVLAERSSDPENALTWWRAAHDVLSGLKQAGRFVSPEDEGYLHLLKAKLGLP
jgi:tetratricopeptide (TPR) repeat protein